MIHFISSVLRVPDVYFLSNGVVRGWYNINGTQKIKIVTCRHDVFVH